MATKRDISNVFVDNADDLYRLKRGKRRKIRMRSSLSYWTERFNRANGAVGNDWAGSTWTIVDGKVINTPSGTEKITNGAMEGTYVSGLAPSWTKMGLPTLSEQVGVTGSAQGITDGDTSPKSVDQNIAHLINRFYQLTGSGKRISGGGSGRLRLLSTIIGASTDVLLFDNAAYVKKVFTYQSIANASSPLRVFSTAGTVVAFDDLSVKLLVTGELFLSRVCSYIDKLRLRVKMKPYSLAKGGIFICLDDVANPLNYIYAILDDRTIPLSEQRGFVSLYKCVNGLHTQLLNVEVNWYEDKYLELIRKDRTTFAVYYDEVQIGADQTVNVAAILDNTNVGLLSTDVNISFDDFDIAHTATPYKIPSGTLLYTFVDASDIHAADVKWTAGQLDAFVTQINTINADANFLLGDLSKDGTQAQIDTFNAAFNNLTKPTYEIDGNHDVQGGLDLFPHHFVYNGNGFTIIAFYTTSPVGVAPNGQIDGAELAWLENELINATGKIILMSHVPVWDPDNSHIQSGYGQEEVMSLCVKYGVKAVFSGHTHQLGHYNLVNGVSYWNGPAALAAYGGFQVLSLYSDRIELYRYRSRTPFGLVGANFPIRFWF